MDYRLESGCSYFDPTQGDPRCTDPSPKPPFKQMGTVAQVTCLLSTSLRCHTAGKKESVTALRDALAGGLVLSAFFLKLQQS